MAKKHRSPSYPAIDLKSAVSLLRKIYPAAKHALGGDVIATEWKYKNQASASPYLAAMKQYGLLAEERSGEDRLFKLTPTALDIAVDSECTTPECKAALQNAARNPKIHKELWDKWGVPLPPDGELRRYLERERDFNPNYVSRFIKGYKATIEYAKLDNSPQGDADSAVDTAKNGNGPETPRKEVRVGSFVQWTSEGQVQFADPLKVIEIDESGEWAFVEGNETGLPMSELSVIESLEKPVTPPSVATPPKNPHFRREVASGPRIEFPLPDDNSIVIQLKMPVSKKTFERIKQLVELSEDSLVAEEDGGDY